MIQWEIGQEVVHQYGHSKRQASAPATITRIGRKYVYAKVFGREQAFNKDDGYVPNWRGGRLVTPEILAAEERRNAAMERTKRLRDYGAFDRLSVDQIERIAEIIEEG